MNTGVVGTTHLSTNLYHLSYISTHEYWKVEAVSILVHAQSAMSEFLCNRHSREKDIG